MLNSTELHFFYVISLHDSLASAARALNVTPPTVTQRLQAIEKKLQVKLVNRKPKSCTLTEEGNILAQRAKNVLEEINNIHENIYNLKNDLAGEFNIFGPLGFGHKYIAPLVSEFNQKYPRVNIDFVLSDNPTAYSNQPWDIIIHIGELQNSEMKMRVLAKNNRYLCASPAYVEAYGEPQHPDDLRLHRCIALRENSEDVTMWRFEHGKTHKRYSVRIHPALSSNTGPVTKQWALDGCGIIMRSEWDVIEEIQNGTLVRLLGDYNLPSANIIALLNSNPNNRSAKTEKFLELLLERVSNDSWPHLEQNQS